MRRWIIFMFALALIANASSWSAKEDDHSKEEEEEIDEDDIEVHKSGACECIPYYRCESRMTVEESDAKEDPCPNYLDVCCDI